MTVYIQVRSLSSFLRPLAAQVGEYLALRTDGVADGARLRSLFIQRAWRQDSLAILVEEVEAWLRQQGILLPAVSALQRLIGQDRVTAESAHQRHRGLEHGLDDGGTGSSALHGSPGER